MAAWAVWAAAALGALVVLLRVSANARRRQSFWLLAGVPIAFVLARAFAENETDSTALGGLGLAFIGAHVLSFGDIWARFNQRSSGRVVKWHREYSHSRLLVVTLGLGMGVFGLAAVISA